MCQVFSKGELAKLTLDVEEGKAMSAPGPEMNAGAIC